MADIELEFFLNGEPVKVNVNPATSLLTVLRDYLGLTGTKKGCGRGECGACTVILDGQAVNSCLLPAVKVRGRRVETIEGLARGEQLHPLQQAFIKAGAVQCGFCTPGMIMAAKALLDHNPRPTRDEIKEAISGNICRCTGYVKIEEAIMQAARGTGGIKNEGCC
ncbi:Nicotinate dehydrogenase small FeS subunit [Neomoorella glycerini]|uniref:Nicotinate dehydrogenase small FeS subunit n=1 Tax=Neomoorella glycerini TaxID=55779 RepID=A0A6I5ZNN7_9FIRM|nr:(2Fe-2S)-binding protein [Moorella glycerini]QGP91217.1 Nicotinate dehydrogenase small FeS subunit [Moorella glycerini]